MKPILCYVTDGRSLAARARGAAPDRVALLVQRVRRAVDAGVDWVQVREKDMDGGALASLARECIAAVGSGSTRIIVNDRLDVAVACGAHGVHLGGESLPVRDVVSWIRGGRSQSPEAPQPAGTFLVGRSCHSPEEARAAEADGASYIVFGPVFSTPSKQQFGPPQGLERIAGVCRASRIPVIAIGGITAEKAAECIRVGASGIAAIRLFQESDDLPALVGAIRRPAS